MNEEQEKIEKDNEQDEKTGAEKGHDDKSAVIMNNINETEEGIRANRANNSDLKMRMSGDTELKMKMSGDTELKKSKIRLRSGLMSGDTESKKSKIRLKIKTLELKIKTSEGSRASMLCDYINMHPQPFKVKVEDISTAFWLQIKSSMMPNARGERLKQKQGMKNISAFAGEDDILNPTMIDAQTHQGNKNYLSLETAYIRKRNLTGTTQEINDDWVIDRFNTLKRKFKENRGIRSKLVTMMLQRRTETSAINAEQEIEEAVCKVHQEGKEKREQIRKEHKIKMALIREQCLNSTEEESMMTAEAEEYEDKMEDFHMEQQARIAAVIIQTVKYTTDESDRIKGEISSCDVVQSMIMTEVMVIKAIIDAAEIPLSEKQKMMEVIDNNDDLWLRCWTETNIPRNVEEFKRRTGLTVYEIRWLDQLREANGLDMLSQSEKMNPENIPEDEIEQVIAASPLVERGGRIISVTADTST